MRHKGAFKILPEIIVIYAVGNDHNLWYER